MRKTALWSAVLAMVAGTLLASAGPAQAFDRGTCNSFYGSQFVRSVRTIRINTDPVANVDFGDHPHWFGEPLGDGVACFATDGRIALFGRAFADSSALIFVQAKVTFLTNDGGSYSPPTVEGWRNNGGSVYVAKHTGNVRIFSRVRLQLFQGTQRVYSITL